MLQSERGLFLLVAAFMAVEWVQRRHPTAGLELCWPRPVRWAAYTACIWLCVLRMPNDVPTFIYFQF